MRRRCRPVFSADSRATFFRSAGPANTGGIMVVGQEIALGRIYKHETVSVLVSETTLTVEFGDGDARVIRRTTTRAVRSIKGRRPRTAVYGRTRLGSRRRWP